ncbi:L-lactate permease [Stenotrophomonas sp. Betaine-02u-21]|uniref:L-lactate permease n=1 Tax=unclassified Stenotrophomonas TaxID=196198 RepID=UPI000C31C2C2|nr:MULTISPECIES: lactate permease LctP family transporter [unclassified Stenotrophomonas]PKH69597.1 L-lactate permease [Stenotrophomonas sp. Betaine-02u-23]PKH74637.1 L-lactate permease [Stenotrophomonas sp. Betaine-02u-21]PKH95536.1 L-lactate permease [Stenotrophomonas sp. Bg11-02]
MWQQNYDPLGNPNLSALLAALPVLVFLLALTVLRLKGLTAALLAVVVSVLVSALVFGMPVGTIVGAGLLGIANGVFPISFIVLMAVWLYKLAIRSGKFEVIRGSIATISEDQRIQVLLIAFCFGGFLEGAAGFGVPIAICAALLVELGFRPLKAAMLCLLANGAAGAYGAIGIPVLVGAQQGGVSLDAMSLMLMALVQVIALLSPAILVLMLDGWRGVRETWPVLLVVGAVFSGVQTAVLYLLGPELVDIIGPLAAMAALAGFMQVWRPRRIYREADTPPGPVQRYTLKEVLLAWSPFYILTGAILLWSLPAFKALFAAGGALASTVLHLPIGLLDGRVQELPPLVVNVHTLPAVWNVGWLNASGTAILMAAVLTVLLSPKLNLRMAGEELAQAGREMWKPLATVSLVMAVAYITNYSGASSTIGLALAQTGGVFPLLSPVIGWMGVFITGSVVNSNTLFAHLQAVTAAQIGVPEALLVAANTAGGVMAKLVSPQSIAIAAAAVKLVGQESAIMRTTLGISLGLLAYVCLCTWGLSVLLG